MTRRPMQFGLVLPIVALGVALSLRADTLVLRNGQELHGRVTIEGAKARIELDIGGTVFIDRGEIASTTVEKPPPEATAKAVAVPPELMARLQARENAHRLIEALADEKEKAREKAEDELSKMGRDALPIVRAAFAEGTALQRRHLLHVLAAIGDPASVPRITELLRDPNEKDLHVDAAKALADIAGRDAVVTLTGLLASSKDVDVRIECLRALGELRDPFAAPFVAEAQNDPALRQAARAALAGWHDPVLLPYVLPALDEGSREARVRVAAWFVALITPAHVRTLSRLLDAYKDEKQPELVKALLPGVQRLHKDFPVVGDVELLGASQATIQTFALESLQKNPKGRAKKRGPTPRDWQAERDQATLPHLVLTPVGGVSRALLRELGADLEASLKTPGSALQISVEFGKPVPLAGPEGGSFDARPLLLRLDRECAADPQAVRVVGLTSGDATVPGLEFAMAPTRLGGSALLAMARLGEARDVAGRRVRRLLLHALARSLDLPRCADNTCPSSTIYEPQDIDAMSSRYCAACMAAFAAAWAAEADVAAFRYAAAAAKFTAIAGRTKSRASQARAAYLSEMALEPIAAIEHWKTYQGLDADPAVASLITRRIEMLDRAEKWLTKNKAAPTPPRKGRP